MDVVGHYYGGVQPPASRVTIETGLQDDFSFLRGKSDTFLDAESDEVARAA